MNFLNIPIILTERWNCRKDDDVPNLVAARRSLLYLVLLASLVMTSIRSAEKLTPDQVAALLPQLFKLHLSEHEMNEAFTRRLVKQMVEQLDPANTFLLKSEAEAMHSLSEKELRTLAEKALQGDFTFFQAMLKKFVAQQVKRDDALYDALDKKSDEIKATGNDKEKEKKDAEDKEDDIKWALRPETHPEREKRLMRTAVELYRMNTSYLSEAEALKLALQTLREEHGKWKKADLDEEMPKLFLKSFMLALDPHTEYFDAEDEEEFNTRLERDFAGIGIQIRPCPLGAQVDDIIKGGPSEKSGKLARGDQIIAVDHFSLAGLPINKVVRHIKGLKGTEVKLTVLKKATHATEIITLVRDTINLADMRVKGKKFETPAGTVGYIAVQAFYEGVHNDVGDRLKELEANKALAGVVLDLRYNAGGYLEEAVGLAGLFITSGPIVGEQDGSKRIHWTKDEEEGVAYTGPLIVLVNQFSASASEIVAGALKDYGRAVIVGPTGTYGKGTVQRVIPLAPLNLPGDIKITTHQYFLASGDSVQLKGVEPDVVIPGAKLMEDAGMLERSTENPIPWRRIKGSLDKGRQDVKNWTEWRTKNVALLQQKSTERVANNPEFTDIADPVKRQERLEAQKTLSERLKADELEAGDKDGKDPQAMEAVAIAQDMIENWPAAAKHAAK